LPGGSASTAVGTANPLSTWTVIDAESSNFTSDGRGDYVSGACGVTGEIFYSNYNPATGLGGDATLMPGSGTKRPACGARTIRVQLGSATRTVLLMNVNRVLARNVGDAPFSQNFQVHVDGDKACTRLAWYTVADGGAGGPCSGFWPGGGGVGGAGGAGGVALSGCMCDAQP
jgi:hypothetical protein